MRIDVEFPRVIERRRMQCADAGERRLQIHRIAEALDDRAHPRITAETLLRRARGPIGCC